MKTYFFILLGLGMHICCMAQEPSSAAISKNNEAIKTVGLHFENKDSLEKAIGLFDDAISISPSYTLAYMNKAKYLAKLKRWKEVSDVIAMVEKIELTNSYVYTTKGLYLEKNKKLVEAKKAYQKSIFLFQERLKVKPQKISDFENMLFSMVLLDNKLLSTDSINEMKKSMNLEFNASDEEKFQEFFQKKYQRIKKNDIINNI